CGRSARRASRARRPHCGGKPTPRGGKLIMREGDTQVRGTAEHIPGPVKSDQTAGQIEMAAWKKCFPALEYYFDAWQRSVLFLDVLRERGNNYYEHNASRAPNVLTFKAELVRDGRKLKRPVNYLLTRVVPPEGTKIDPAKPPFIVVDPRAGHGPGIGGMKQDSEIGVALSAGHACYFIGFLPAPMPGQTVEDVCRAEAIFIEDVVALHPQAEEKPVIIANCQAGWQIMMMAAIRPDL